MENECSATPSRRSSGPPSGRRTSRHTRNPSHERACNEEPQRKRPKRGNYAPKACINCQRKKTKCKGGYPCNACSAKGLSCSVRNIEPRRQQHSPEISRHQPEEDLVTALSKIQRQLNEIIGRDQRIDNTRENGKATTPRPLAPGEPVTPCRRTSRNEPDFRSDAEAFSGEPSIVHVLHEMESHLERLGMGHTLMASPPTSQPLTPVHSSSHDTNSQNRILEVLGSHGIAIDKSEWDQLLHTFFDEIYVLYPFLHPPTVRSTYEDLCDMILLRPSKSYETPNDRAKIAQVLFCLATGRCSESTRTDAGEGRHSAGWSLFRAGMDILGELLEILDDYSAALESLQAILLAVIYLFRIDANNKAEKLLALVVSHSHSMGLHRKRVTDEISIFEAEMCRRVWWCTYIIDRRLALDTGRPFLIQDVNTDVPAPLELSEEWLSQHIHTTQTSKQLEDEIKIEIGRKSITPLPHLAAMIDFSRVVGKVWEAHFGVPDMNPGSTPLTTEYLEFLVSSTVQKDLSRVWSGSREPFHVQFAGMEWWQIKQKMLMRIRWLFLRLLIRKSTLRMPCLSEVDENANAMTCIQLSRSIILEFNHIPDKYPKHTFPFINYVATAVVIALGLIIKQPTFKSMDITFVSLAAEILKRFCTQTWVSGRIIRAVAKIDQVSKLAVGRSMEAQQCLLGPLNDNATALSDPIPEGSRPHLGTIPGNAFQCTTNDDSGKSIHHQRNDINILPSHIGLPLHQTFPQESHYSINSQQAPSNIILDANSSISSQWALDDLTMTDFDFEEGLRRHNEPGGGWPWVSEFWDAGFSMHSDAHEESLFLDKTSFEPSERNHLERIDAEAFEPRQMNMFNSNPPIGNQSMVLQSHFLTEL